MLPCEEATFSCKGFLGNLNKQFPMTIKEQLNILVDMVHLFYSVELLRTFWMISSNYGGDVSIYGI